MIAAVLAGMLAVAAGPAQAAEPFPNRPITLVIPFAPGDTDAMLRPVADRMGEFLGQPVTLAYKPGAGGGVGAGSVAAAKPDGYTLVGSSPGSLVVVPLANKDVKYSTDSFTPVAGIAEGGFMLVVPGASRFNSLQDLLDFSLKNPGQLSYSTSGAHGITHLLAEVFAKEAAVRWNHIPFQGSGPAITALLGGHVDMSSTAIGPAQAHLKAGTLRALAVFGDSRLKAYPNVPTFKELGYKMGSSSLYGIAAPKDTPPEVVQALYAAASKALEKYREPIAAALATLGAEPRLLGPQEYAAYLRQQQQLFSAGLRTLGN